ncbi:EamA family transporter [Aliiglaciecola sp. 3_MG-2023]|uniref:DMT family transporter n=1 Tax=Alteromonadaceae TaxID=72275 RepID=UPI0026E1AA57|nr:MULTISPECIES: EamA family transporter [unclassified Aliiglaciecola]MDO6692107.1 EamA family transporter [Aliiglaciecola sp. 3_MG-2023]MDO6709589.1 EamA family transporter [Aliiglaciecola sp. 2_MG-2023]MDO6750869.1 EamA family transporter [Aliiglaciecola sp. 1_MG-2023]
MSQQFHVFKSIFAIVIASFLWGTTGVAASYAPDISSLAIGAFSMGIGGVLLVFSARSKLRADFRLMLAYPHFVLFGGACVAIYPLAFYTSMRFSGVAIGTVISIASAPFFAALYERVISKKNISVQWIVSFVIGVIGIVLLVIGKTDGLVTSTHQTLQYVGIILGLLAGLTYAGYSWAAKHLIEKGIDSQSSMAGLFGLAALLLLPSLWFTGANLFSTVTNTSVALYMAFFPMFLGYLLFGFGLKLVDASRATLITLIEPLVATFLAVIIVGEDFKLIGWFGMGLISLCLALQTVKFKLQPQMDSVVISKT